MCNTPVERGLINTELIFNSQEDNLPNPINNITKAKLNLHVKRRLQYDYEDSPKNPRINHTSNNTNSNNNINKTEECCVKTKSKRPYNKRMEKNTPSANAIELLQGRKCKQKFKQLLTNTDDAVGDVLPPRVGQNRGNQVTNRLTSAGDDDSGGQEADIRSIKEQYKCQDVLSMVLSVKKRNLLQDPQVQVVLSQIMKVINS